MRLPEADGSCPSRHGWRFGAARAARVAQPAARAAKCGWSSVGGSAFDPWLLRVPSRRWPVCRGEAWPRSPATPARRGSPGPIHTQGRQGGPVWTSSSIPSATTWAGVPSRRALGTTSPRRQVGCPSRIRTSVHGSKVRCPTTRRRGSGRRPREIPGACRARKWSGRRDSNPRPSPWQGDALPTEPLPLDERDHQRSVVPRARIELATPRFSVACSTN
jgi:hypothetical protein